MAEPLLGIPSRGRGLLDRAELIGRITMDVEGFLAEIRSDPAYADQIVHVHETPAREAEYAPTARPLPAPIRDMLAARGIDELYTHQAEAVDAAHDGHNVLVASGTASGKTLAYVVPVLALSTVLTSPVRGSSIHIPEPMIFDLVRPLGAKQGEIEVNTLLQYPLDESPNRDSGTGGLTDEGKLLWAPEIEAAVLDGLGLELELPFEGSELEALKFAVQYTLRVPPSWRYIHGLQFIGERFLHPDLWELSLVYIPGARFSGTWSTLGMLGVRTTLQSGNSVQTEGLFNFSIFADLGTRTTLGLETDTAADFKGDYDILLMPQVHHEISGRWMIQGGVGARFIPEASRSELGGRVVYTF